jgi:hypothetical protein
MTAAYALKRMDRPAPAAGPIAQQLRCDVLPPLPVLRATPFSDIAVSGTLGEGRRCAVFAAVCRGRQVVLKVYHSQAVAKHARRLGGSLARYEYEQNVALRGVAQLATHIADPIACFSSPCCELFVQERVFGEALEAYLRTCSATDRAYVLGECRSIVERAHSAGVFDLDLHPRNILVRQSAQGGAQPVLFDFNKTPYHVRPPNPFVAMLLKLGLLTPAFRDYRLLRRLHRLCDALPAPSGELSHRPSRDSRT